MVQPLPATSARHRAALADERESAQNRIRWELLVQLVRTDLKVKYQGSVLGFAWSLANPLLLMTIYYVIFTKLFDNGIEGYAIYLMAGLLPFTAFSQAVTAATQSVTSSAGLVKKVRFPRMVLPMASVGFAMTQFLLQLVLLVVLVLAFSPARIGPELLFAIPALALLVLFSTALAVLVSALNVRYRDTSHFVEIAMIVWLWANPIVYPAGYAKTELDTYHAFWAYFLNPMATVVTTFQRAVFNQPYYTAPDGSRALTLPDAGYAFYVRNLVLGFVITALLLLLARRVFTRMQPHFAEQL
ncbi:MAG: ABC transporter permease [Mycobacteriales bacterium]|nr:ABC transporter permease [Mycobacteriales bacterium]